MDGLSLLIPTDSHLVLLLYPLAPVYSLGESEKNLQVLGSLEEQEDHSFLSNYSLVKFCQDDVQAPTAEPLLGLSDSIKLDFRLASEVLDPLLACNAAILEVVITLSRGCLDIVGVAGALGNP